MQGPIEKTLRWVAIIGVFLLPFIPLIVSTSLFFPYITGKNFAFRVIIEVIGFAWLALALLEPKFRPRRSWIFAAFAVFIVIIAIADAQGAMPFKSFWSNYERMDGWVTIAHLFVYLVVAACVMNAENLWRYLFELSLGISIFLDLYGFSQIFGVLALGEGGTAGWSARIDATFGNPIYLAAYMLFHIFIAALLWNQFWARSSTGKRLWPSVWYGAVIVLDTIALLFTGTRGTTIGLVGGAILAGLIYVFLTPSAKEARRYFIGAVVVLVVLLGGLWLARDTAFVKSVGFLDRIASISLTDDTTMARLLNWGIAWQGVKERPILGWGQENYAIVFDKYYDPRMYAQEPWFDRVHNIVFDWWVAGGTLGLLAYLSIFVAALWVLWRSRAFTVAERSILIGLLAGYFCHLFFVFDNVTSYILFGTILAYIVWRASEADSAGAIPFPTLPRGSSPLVALVAAALAVGVAWWVNAAALEENAAIIAGLAQEPGGLSENLADFELAISYGTYGTQEAREQLAQVATSLASASVSTDTKQQFLTEAAAQLEAQAKLSPLDARFPLFEGVMLDAYGQYSAAEAPLQKAHELSPRKQSILFEMALNAEARGDTTGALALFKEAYDLDHADTDALIYYAVGAISAKQDALADQLLAPIIPTGQAADPRIEAAYVSRGLYSKLLPIWKAHVAAQPDDVQGYFTLAAIYYELGDKNDAIQSLKNAEAKNSSIAAQAEALIGEIKSGTAKVGS